MENADFVLQFRLRAKQPAVVGAALLAVLFFSGKAGAAAARALPRSLAATVQRIMGVPAGKRVYLPQYRRVIRFIQAAVATQPPKSQREILHGAPFAVKAEVRSIVAAINGGADVTALRNDVLAHITLSGYGTKGARRWRYGTMWDRFLFTCLLAIHSRHLLSRGKRSVAAEYARAGLLLRCQDDVAVGGRVMCLYYWFGTSTPQRTRNGLALGLSAGRMRKLKHLYSAAVRWHYAFASPKRPFFSATSAMQGAERKAVRPSLLRDYLGGLRSAVRETRGAIGWRYRILRIVLGTRRSLNLGGHHAAAKQIKAFLQRWAVRIKADHAMPKLERDALLRWIKEASI